MLRSSLAAINDAAPVADRIVGTLAAKVGLSDLALLNVRNSHARRDPIC
jgi:hypothetical protein